MTAALALAPRRIQHTLFEYLEDVEAIQTTLDSLADDETSDDARADLERMLAEALAGTKAKVDRTAGILTAFETAAGAAKAEAARCTARVKHFERQIEQIEERVLAIMAAAGIKNLDGAVSTLTSRANPLKVVIDDVEEIPPILMRSPPIPDDVPDKKAIAESWKRGVGVAGTHVEAGSRLERK